MAPKSVTSPPKLFFLLLLAMFIFSEAYDPSLKETKMALHFQHREAGPNATSGILTGIPGKLWSFNGFGTIFVTDDPVTAGPDQNSPQIARAQGIYVASSVDGSNVHVMISIAFTTNYKGYIGSTLEIQGSSAQFSSVREMSVAGGTGKFRFARGYATFETIKLDIPNFYAVVRCNVTVLHC